MYDGRKSGSGTARSFLVPLSDPQNAMTRHSIVTRKSLKHSSIAKNVQSAIGRSVCAWIAVRQALDRLRKERRISHRSTRRKTRTVTGDGRESQRCKGIPRTCRSCQGRSSTIAGATGRSILAPMRGTVEYRAEVAEQLGTDANSVGVLGASGADATAVTCSRMSNPVRCQNQTEARTSYER